MHTTLRSLVALTALAFPVVALQDESRWGADYFPDVELTTHEGRTVRFFEDLVEGRVVAINFMYTSCPDACPLETARLVEVQGILGDRVGTDVFMYSISIDPDRDSVEALAAYAERFGAGPGWKFLRGTSEDVDLLRRKLGVLARDETDLEQHSLSLVIGNQSTGRWMRRSPFESPYVLAEEIGSWLHNWKQGPRGGPDYDEAPQLRDVTKGERLFRTRCSACHTLGVDDGVKRVGPDLLGVTRVRERAWLERWLAEPDVMLAEGDPLALELFERHKRVPMPNMRLNPVEVGALLEHIEDETAFLDPEPAGLGADGGGWASDALAGAAVEPAVGGCCLKKQIPGALAAAPAPAAEELAHEPDGAPSSPGRAAFLAMTLLLALGAGAMVLGHRSSLRS